MMPSPSDRQWLALCLCTESNRPEEWRYIAAVIFNRVLSKRYPATIERVVLQPKQFSAFNAVTGAGVTLSKEGMFRAVFKNHVKDPVMLAQAVEMSCSFIAGGAPEISPATLHYFSPVSMVPKGSHPPWAKTAKRLYSPAGVDPERFIFAEAVA